MQSISMSYETLLSIYAFIDHVDAALLITKKNLQLIQFLGSPNNNYYFDFYRDVNNSNNIKNNIFIDNDYWYLHSWQRYDLKYMNSIPTNQGVWNRRNSLVIEKINTYNFWFNLYPLNTESYIWNSIDRSLFKTYLYKFPKYTYDINYIPSFQLKHHDYANPQIYVCSNLLGQPYIHNKTMITGLCFFWYENFGSVEIPYKLVWVYWYHFYYPYLEEFAALANNSPFASTSYDMAFQDSIIQLQDRYMILKHRMRFSMHGNAIFPE